MRRSRRLRVENNCLVPGCVDSLWVRFVRGVTCNGRRRSACVVEPESPSLAWSMLGPVTVRLPVSHVLGERPVE